MYVCTYIFNWQKCCLSFWEQYPWDQFHFSLLWYKVDFESTLYKGVPCFACFLFFLLNFPETWSSQVRIFNLSQKFVPKLILSYILIPKVKVSDKDKCSMKEIIFIKKTWRDCFCDITDWGTCLGQGCPHKQGYWKEHTLLSMLTSSASILCFLWWKNHRVNWFW